MHKPTPRGQGVYTGQVGTINPLSHVCGVLARAVKVRVVANSGGKVHGGVGLVHDEGSDGRLLPRARGEQLRDAPAHLHRSSVLRHHTKRLHSKYYYFVTHRPPIGPAEGHKGVESGARKGRAPERRITPGTPAQEFSCSCQVEN